DSASWYTLEAWGGRVEIETGTPVVRIRGETRPVSAAASVKGRTLMLPVQFVAEVLPYALPNMRWDADSSQLVLFMPMLASASSGMRQIVESRPSPAPARSAEAHGTLPPPQQKTARRMIVVDAGHGGVDNGMTGPIGGGPKIYEKNITLAVATRLGDALKARGVDVAYT